MTVLKIMHKALVMKHCLSRAEDLNGDREPLFPFFKFSFCCMRVCVCVFVYFIHVSILLLLTFLLTFYLNFLRLLLFYFDIAFTHFVEKMRIQNTENSEKQNSETKQEIRTNREVSNDKTKL